MKEIKSLQNETKLFIVILLIFLIIFHSTLNPENKFYKALLYSIFFILFVVKLFLLKQYPEIVILYSSLFILIWYQYNLKKNNNNNLPEN
jgi:energy-coupling factor transporter transmembrane protein EcfT